MSQDQETDTVTEKQEEPKTRRGRPRAEVDLEAVYKLASVGCTIRECSYVLDVHEDTIKRRQDVRDAYDRGVENSKYRLRKAMFANAIDRMNPTMQIWLSKQILDMSENGSTNIDTGVLPWTDD